MAKQAGQRDRAEAEIAADLQREADAPMEIPGDATFLEHPGPGDETFTGDPAVYGPNDYVEVGAPIETIEQALAATGLPSLRAVVDLALLGAAVRVANASAPAAEPYPRPDPAWPWHTDWELPTAEFATRFPLVYSGGRRVRVAGDPSGADPTLIVTSKIAGFRRGGLAHPDTPQTYPLSRFSPAQVEAILAEPNLITEIV